MPTYTNPNPNPTPSRGIIMADNDSDAMHKQCHFKLAIVATVNFTMNYYTAILFFPHFYVYLFFFFYGFSKQQLNKRVELAVEYNCTSLGRKYDLILNCKLGRN